MVGHCVLQYKFNTDIAAFEHVAENDRLSKNDLRVFMFLCCRVGSKNAVKIDKSQIAESLGISKSKVDDSLENLEEEQIICHETDDHVKNGIKMCYTKFLT